MESCLVGTHIAFSYIYKHTVYIDYDRTLLRIYTSKTIKQMLTCPTIKQKFMKPKSHLWIVNTVVYKTIDKQN